MSTNFLANNFRGAITSSLIQEVSQELGESSASISSAFDHIGSVLSGAILQASDTNANELYQQLAQNALTNIGQEDLYLSQPDIESKGNSLLTFLFKNKQSQIVDHISAANGLRTSSASTLLKKFSPLFAGIVLQLAEQHGQGTKGLASLLDENQTTVSNSIPTATQELLKMNIEAPVSSARVETDDVNTIPVQSSTLSKLLPWIVLLIAALGLFYFLQKGTNAPPAAPQPTPQDTTVTQPTPGQVPDTSLADTTWMVDPDTIN